MSRYIRIDDLEQYSLSQVINGVINIQKLKTADVVEVVRCKDCKFYQDNNGGYPNMNCRWIDDETPNEDDYCSYGERREDGKD